MGILKVRYIIPLGPRSSTVTRDKFVWFCLFAQSSGTMPGGHISTGLHIWCTVCTDWTPSYASLCKIFYLKTGFFNMTISWDVAHAFPAKPVSSFLLHLFLYLLTFLKKWFWKFGGWDGMYAHYSFIAWMWSNPCSYSGIDHFEENGVQAPLLVTQLSPS